VRCAWIVVAIGLVGCDPITPITPSPAPVNSCDAGPCSVGTAPAFVLVVTVPALAQASAGATYAIPSSALPASGVNLCTGGNTPDDCFLLPPLAPADGVYDITSGQAITANRPVELPGGPLYDVSLPVTTTFWPQWFAPGASTATDARYLNLPLPPVVATLETNIEVSLPQPMETPSPPGSPGNNPLVWSAELPPLSTYGAYTGVVQVTSPFNDGFPDSHYTVVPHAFEVGSSSASLLREPVQGLEITRGDGAALGKGWMVYLRDQATLGAISSRATLGADQTTTQLNVFQSASQMNSNFVVDPPPGMNLPELVTNLVTPSGLQLFQQFSPLVYPVLPPAIHVSGTVRSPENTAVSSTLLFYSTAFEPPASCQTSKNPTAGNQLFYETVVHTADQIAAGGAVGEFNVDLPQATYAVVIEPSAESGYAKGTDTYLRAMASDGTTCTGPAPTLSDVVLSVLHPITVTGRIVTSDGRPLANADVDFTPAAALVLGLNPATPPQNQEPFVTFTARDTWPRPFTTTTGDEGSFSIEVDPETGGEFQYDLTVRPQMGTGFPWIVRANHIYAAGMAPLETLVVPPPYPLSVTLRDPNENPLANAIVQAYAFTPVVVGVGTNKVTYPVAVAIGEAMTDASGHFGMMLTAPTTTAVASSN
jgi:hypothetical protein